MSTGNEIWGKRLKEIRLAAGLSQKQLGIQAGLDPFVASARINRYELGIHKADYKIAQKLSAVLNIPTAFFYTEDENLAEIMVIFHRTNPKKRSELLKIARSLISQERTS